MALALVPGAFNGHDDEDHEHGDEDERLEFPSAEDLEYFHDVTDFDISALEAELDLWKVCKMLLLFVSVIICVIDFIHAIDI